MLYPPCPLCGGAVRLRLAGFWAFEAAAGNAGQVPAALRAYILEAGPTAPVFVCSCGWSGVLLVAEGSSPEQLG